MRYTSASAAFIGLSVCAAPVLAGQPAFMMFDFEDAADVTVDQFGHTQVLLLDFGTIWIENVTVGGTTYVGDGTAHRLSADATAIGGSANNADGIKEAVKWTVGSGFEWLGALPNAGTCPSISSGYAASGDGSVLVGLSWDGCSGRGFRWTAEEGMTELESLGNGGNRASVISNDGQVIAGFAQGSFSRTPAVWNASDNSGWLFDIDAQGEVGAINHDGSIVAGQYYDDTFPGFYYFPFCWTEGSGVVPLPYLPEYPGGHILGTSDDGKTLVGISGTILEGRVAAAWRPEWGVVELKAKLIELGIPVPELFIPQVARGVTDDGETVVGWGILFPSNPEEQAELRGFIAQLPPQVDPLCPEDLDGDLQVGFTDLTQLLGTWGPCPACPEDLDGDGAVGFTDLTQLLGNWGPCA